MIPAVAAWTPIRQGHPADRRSDGAPWVESSPLRFARAWHPDGLDWPLVTLEIRRFGDTASMMIRVRRDRFGEDQRDPDIPADALVLVSAALSEYVGR